MQDFIPTPPLHPPLHPFLCLCSYLGVQAMIFFRGPLCLVLFHCFKNPNVFYYHAIKCSLVENWDLLTHIGLQAKFFFWVTLGFSTIHFQLFGSR
jgi:hypothetical protein